MAAYHSWLWLGMARDHGRGDLGVPDARSSALTIADLSVVASLHGLPDGLVGDAVLREVLDGEQHHVAARIPRPSYQPEATIPTRLSLSLVVGVKVDPVAQRPVVCSRLRLVGDRLSIGRG